MVQHPRLASYLFDANALISLIATRSPRPPLRRLNQMVESGQLRAPASVVRECKRKQDRLRAWLVRNESIVLEEHQSRITELSRVVREYERYIRGSRGAADYTLIAMAIHLREERIVVTDDAGVQIALTQEGVRHWPLRAFRDYEGL